MTLRKTFNDYNMSKWSYLANLLNLQFMITQYQPYSREYDGNID